MLKTKGTPLFLLDLAAFKFQPCRYCPAKKTFGTYNLKKIISMPVDIQSEFPVLSVDDLNIISQ
jgi:hypothetical protein